VKQPQHLVALEKANRTRYARVALHREIAAGEVSVSELLRNPLPDWLEHEPIGELLRALPRVGKVKAAEILVHAQRPGPGGFVTPLKYNRHVGDLTPRLRAQVADELERRGK
jgi:hypothetical protein